MIEVHSVGVRMLVRRWMEWDGFVREGGYGSVLSTVVGFGCDIMGGG